MQWEVLAYFAILNLAVGLGSPLGIAAIPITYFLKDRLHLSPVRLAVFLAVASIPVCAGFALRLHPRPMAQRELGRSPIPVRLRAGRRGRVPLVSHFDD